MLSWRVEEQQNVEVEGGEQQSVKLEGLVQQC